MAGASAAEIWRDYETDGVPASGAHQPSKSEIRAYLAGVEASLALVDAALSSDITNASYRVELARRRFLFASAV